VAETFEEALDELLLEWSGEQVGEIINVLELKISKLVNERRDDDEPDEPE
jgi:hypothetical protein